jgi:RNA polymerase sigma-70 factor (ECF subfamily)
MRAVVTGQSPVVDLLGGLRRGDPEAIAEAYDDHHEAIRAFATRLLGDEALAEDLVHEVFVSLPEVIHSFRGESALRTFLIGVAVNHGRRHVRNAARRRAILEQAHRDSAPPSSPTPERQLETQAFLAILDRALDELPIEQRVAFVLCDVEERSSAEVSQIVGAPEATVRTRLRQARLKLREVLEAEGLR